MGDNETIFKELRNKYNTGTATWTVPPTEFPNEDFDRPGSNAETPSVLWTRFTVVFGESRAMDIGSPVKTFRTPGVLIIQFFAPTGTGTITVRKKADALADIFRNWCGATVRCREASVIDIGTDRNGWYQVNLNVSFQSDSLH
jgi:hypothetical protein